MPDDRAQAPADAPDSSALNSILSKNIDALQQKQAEQAARAGFQERLAEVITRFTGSMAFVYLHLALVGGWIAVNTGFVPAVPAFDPTFVILATVASVEAIFLSTFVLISQNRATRMADRQAQLDLQTSLLAEHEITRILNITLAIADKLEIKVDDGDEMEELKRDISPEQVLEEIDRKSDDAGD